MANYDIPSIGSNSGLVSATTTLLDSCVDRQQKNNTDISSAVNRIKSVITKLQHCALPPQHGGVDNDPKENKGVLDELYSSLDEEQEQIKTLHSLIDELQRLL